MAAGSALRVSGAQPRSRADDPRFTRAKAALQAAELRTGVKEWGSELPRLRALPSPPEPAVADACLCPDLDWRRSGDGAGLPVQAALRRLIPGGAISPGSVCSVQGSMSLLFGLLAEASQASAWIAVVGAEAAGILAAAQAGLSLERLALVPQPGLDAARVVAALLDGMDAVVVGPHTALSAADRRRLTARARERGAVIVSTLPWEGAGVSLTAIGGSWQGADAGAGWLKERSVVVQRSGRGMAARTRTFEVSVPLGYRSDSGGRSRDQAEPVLLRRAS